MPILIAVDDLDGIVHVGRDALDKRNLALDGLGVGNRQCDCVMRPGADAVDRAPAGFNPHEVVAQIVELLFDAGLARLANGHHANHRRNPDSDSQDGQRSCAFCSSARPPERIEKEPSNSQFPRGLW